jgi:hypothetical protein
VGGIRCLPALRALLVAQLPRAVQTPSLVGGVLIYTASWTCCAPCLKRNPHEALSRSLSTAVTPLLLLLLRSRAEVAVPSLSMAQYGKTSYWDERYTK